MGDWQFIRRLHIRSRGMSTRKQFPLPRTWTRRDKWWAMKTIIYEATLIADWGRGKSSIVVVDVSSCDWQRHHIHPKHLSRRWNLSWRLRVFFVSPNHDLNFSCDARIISIHGLIRYITCGSTPTISSVVTLRQTVEVLTSTAPTTARESAEGCFSFSRISVTIRIVSCIFFIQIFHRRFSSFGDGEKIFRIKTLASSLACGSWTTQLKSVGSEWGSVCGRVF